MMPLSWNEIRSRALAFAKEWGERVKLDRAVDKCYRSQPFVSERNRVEFLFGLYQELTAPLLGAEPRQRRS